MQARSDTPFTISLRELALVVFKRKWGMLAIFLATVLSALVYVTIISDELYRSEAKLLVRRGQEQAPLPTLIGDRGVLLNNPKTDVNSEIDLLTSADLLVQLIDDLKLDRLPPPPPPEGGFALVRYYLKRGFASIKDGINEALITIGFRRRLTPREEMVVGLGKAINVATGGDTNVLTASLTWKYREGTDLVLDRLIDLYLDSRPKVYQGATALGFFTERQTETRDRLARAEAAMSRFETDAGIRLLDQQKSVLLTRLADADQDVGRARLAFEEARDKAARLDAVLRKQNVEIAELGDFDPNSFPQEILEKLAALMADREAMRPARSQQSEVEATGRRIAVMIGILSNHLHSVLGEKRAALDAKTAMRDGLRAELDGLHANEVRWRELRREVDSAQDAFRFNEQKLEEARAIAALEEARIGSVVIVQRATMPILPVGIGKSVVLLLATILGVLAAIAWAALREFFDHRIYTPQDLRRHLRAPVIGVVPLDHRLTARAA